jgi:hypothetical protein
MAARHSRVTSSTIFRTRKRRPIGQPISYRGSDGQQYIAILSGVGGWPGVVANAEVDQRVRNAALGFTGATQDLPFYTAGGSELLVFKLGGANGEDTSHAPPK